MKELFPAPGPDIDIPEPYITINELFGGATPDGLDPNTKLPFRIGDLRTTLTNVILREGKHLPA